MTIKFYQVGGSIRDEILGRKPKDFDYAVEAPSFDAMRAEIVGRGGEIFVEHPEFLTIRAKMPMTGPADFVLTRKESHYTDGRRPDSVTIGNIYDDLERRDMSINAIAKSLDTGEIIDPYHGIDDIKNRLLKAVGCPKDRIQEDALRLVRFFRFHVTLGFDLDFAIVDCLHSPEYINLLENISEERIYNELTKCFRHNTLRSLRALETFRLFQLWIFSKNIWLKPTLEKR